MGSRERATLDIVEQAARQQDSRRFVQQLNLNGRLTPSLLMRGLCLGHIEFRRVRHGRTWRRFRISACGCLMHDSGPLGLKAAFDRAGLPPRLFPSFRAAIEVYPPDRTRRRRR